MALWYIILFCKHIGITALLFSSRLLRSRCVAIDQVVHDPLRLVLKILYLPVIRLLQRSSHSRRQAWRARRLTKPTVFSYVTLYQDLVRALVGTSVFRGTAARILPQGAARKRRSTSVVTAQFSRSIASSMESLVAWPSRSRSRSCSRSRSRLRHCTGRRVGVGPGDLRLRGRGGSGVTLRLHGSSSGRHAHTLGSSPFHKNASLNCSPFFSSQSARALCWSDA